MRLYDTGLFLYLLNYMNDNILSSVVVQIIYRYKDELIMEIKEKTNEKSPEKIVNKTTETLIKELETMSDQGLHDLFTFFYRLNCNHGNMIYGDKFNEFLESFTSNPFKLHKDKAFRKELIENLIKYSFDHMSLLTAALLLKKRFTIDEVIQNYYSTVDAFGYDMF